MFCLCLLTAFSCIFRIFLVSLPKEFLKKGYNMALKIKNREEAIAVLRDMVHSVQRYGFFSKYKGKMQLFAKNYTISIYVMQFRKYIEKQG